MRGGVAGGGSRGPEHNPAALLGLVGPLASALATWIVVARTAAVAPAKTTGVMVTGLAVKMVFFGV